MCGVIEHFGTAYGGHYVAYKPLFTHDAPLQSDRWVLCDDSQTTLLTKEDIMSRNAYMLLYERINNTNNSN